MKTLIICLFISFNTFAETFTAQRNIEFRSNSQQFISRFEIELMGMDFDQKLHLMVNGAEMKLPARLVEQVQERSSYEVDLGQFVLIPVSYCDEEESIKYLLTVEFEGASVSTVEAKITDLRAIYRYSYDICHDFNPTRLTVRYF